jgi:hypothetical protein
MLLSFFVPDCVKKPLRVLRGCISVNRMMLPEQLSVDHDWCHTVRISRRVFIIFSMRKCKSGVSFACPFFLVAEEENFVSCAPLCTTELVHLVHHVTILHH